MKAGVEALSGGAAQLEIRLVALVKLLQNGELVKMSKRGGNFIFIEDVIEEVGIDALRFIMLTRKNEIPLDLIWPRLLSNLATTGVLCAICPCPRAFGYAQLYGRQ